MSRFPSACKLTLFAVLALLSLLAQASVTASLDTNTITESETLELLLQRDGRASGQADLSPLNKDFEVLGQSSGSSVRFVNGEMSAQAELRLTLAPKRSGRLQVPPIRWGAEASEALSVQVTAASSSAGTGQGRGADASGSGNSAHVFLTHQLEPPSPYVQSATVLTVQLHTDRQLVSASLDFSGNDAVSVEPLGKDSQRSETRDGRRFTVIERRYLLLPQKSGQMELDGPVLDAQVADSSRQSGPFGDVFGGVFNTTRPMRLRGDAIVLSVRPRPDAAIGAHWLPASQLTVEQSLRPESARAAVGEPLTLHLRLSAVGLTATQLPDLASLLTMPEGLKAYPDQPKLDTEIDGNDLVATREQDIAIVASQPGSYSVPPLHIDWWNTSVDAGKRAELPALALNITPGTGVLPAPAEVSPSTGQSPATVASAPTSAPVVASTTVGGARGHFWMWLCAALALLWAFTLAVWLFSRRQSAPARSSEDAPAPASGSGVKASAARQAFLQQCVANNAPLARQKLLAWARTEWPATPPSGLRAIALRLPDAESRALVAELDRACYAETSTPWHGAALAAALTALPKEPTSGGAKPHALPSGLYP